MGGWVDACMCVCLSVCLYVCMHVSMYVSKKTRLVLTYLHASTHRFLPICMGTRMPTQMLACTQIWFGKALCCE